MTYTNVESFRGLKQRFPKLVVCRLLSVVCSCRFIAVWLHGAHSLWIVGREEINEEQTLTKKKIFQFINSSKTFFFAKDCSPTVSPNNFYI